MAAYDPKKLYNCSLWICAIAWRGGIVVTLLGGLLIAWLEKGPKRNFSKIKVVRLTYHFVLHLILKLLQSR